MFPTTHHCCNLDVWALVQSRGVEHCSSVTPERVLSEYNKDLIKKNCFSLSYRHFEQPVSKLLPVPYPSA